MCRCFQCGRGFAEWMEKDDPLELHILYFADCYHMKLYATPTQLHKWMNIRFHMLQKKYRKDAYLAETFLKSETNDEKRNDLTYHLQQTQTVHDSRLCIICYKNEICVVFYPCGHAASCIECHYNIEMTCPVCRARIEEISRIFLP